MLFMIMLSTVILPGAVTLIPTYFVFLQIGWVGTWLPLIVPAFFSWGTNVFLLRQFFLGIPRDLEEAARSTVLARCASSSRSFCRCRARP